MIRVLGTVFAALVGLAFGSFLNVCLSRWPAGESVVKPRSHCRGCGRTLTWWENVPLVSWVALRGRCRTCGVWIGWRYPIVELAVGGLLAFEWWRTFGSASLLSDLNAGFVYWNLFIAAGMMLFYWLLVALAVLDAENLWIPDAVTLPGILLGIAWSVLGAEWVGHALERETTLWKDLGERVLAALAAAGLILLIRWIYWLIRRREGIGLGDAKLMAMLGAWLGLSGALLSFGLGVALGSVVALTVLALRKKHDDAAGWALQKLPLGSFLCIGGIASGLWGERIIHAYLRWAGF